MSGSRRRRELLESTRKSSLNLYIGQLTPVSFESFLKLPMSDDDALADDTVTAPLSVWLGLMMMAAISFWFQV